MPTLEPVQRDAVELDLRAIDLLDRAKDRFDPLCRRIAPEHQRPHTAATRAIGADEFVHVDTVPDRPDFGRCQRKRAPVDADDRRRKPRRRT